MKYRVRGFVFDTKNDAICQINSQKAPLIEGWGQAEGFLFLLSSNYLFTLDPVEEDED